MIQRGRTECMKGEEEEEHTTRENTNTEEEEWDETKKGNRWDETMRIQRKKIGKARMVEVA